MSASAEAELPEEMTFNPNVHETNEHKDPVRNDDGTLRKKKNWKQVAKDRQGRTFNAKVHGEEPTLDHEGFLTVRRRKTVTPIGATNRTEEFINQYREPGYTYYLANDEGGRIEKFTNADWEPVIDPETKKSARMKVGQARSPDTSAVLFRKPIEWYEEDQRKKREMRDLNMKQKLAPNEAQGQYDAERSSPLR